MFAEPDQAGGIQHVEGAVPRIILEKQVEFTTRGHVLMELDEHSRILEARGPVRGCHLQHRRQQQLSVIEHLAGDADARQQPHRLHMIAVLQEKGADHGLRHIQVPVREQTRGGHHPGWQTAQRRHVIRRHGGLVTMLPHPIQAFEHAPTGRQRVIQAHRGLECIDRRGRTLQEHEAMSTFFVQTTEAGIQALEMRERIQGFGDAAQPTLCNCRAQETIPMIREPGEQRLGGGQRLGKPLLPEECANARQFVRRIHGPTLNHGRTTLSASPFTADATRSSGRGRSPPGLTPAPGLPT